MPCMALVFFLEGFLAWWLKSLLPSHLENQIKIAPQPKFLFIYCQDLNFDPGFLTTDWCYMKPRIFAPFCFPPRRREEPFPFSSTPSLKLTWPLAVQQSSCHCCCCCSLLETTPQTHTDIKFSFHFCTSVRRPQTSRRQTAFSLFIAPFA